VEKLEIILNLWYVYDETGFIYSLRARCYLGSGDDQEKLALIRRFAPIDYLIAQPFPVPKRFHTTIVEGDRQERLPVVSVASLEALGGPGVLFEEAFVVLEKQLPAQTQLSIGKQPLCCITPLLADANDNIKPVLKSGTKTGANPEPKTGFRPF